MTALSSSTHWIPKRHLLAAAVLLLVLSFFSAAYLRNPTQLNAEEKALQRYVHRQEADFAQLLKDTVLLRRLVQQSEPLTEFKELVNKKYGIYLYVETSGGPELIFWNNQLVLPSQESFSSPDSTWFQRLSNGYYVVRKQKLILPGTPLRIQAFSLIPIYYQHDNRSRYLTTRFVHDRNAHRKIGFSISPSRFAINSIDGKVLFYITRKAYTPEPDSDTVTFLLRLTALILLLIYLHLTADSLSKRRGPLVGILFLVASLITLRVITFLLPQFFGFNQFRLFNPDVYASNAINPSLGDLLLNTLIGCWIVIFCWYQSGAIRSIPVYLKPKPKYIAASAALLCLILCTFEVANIVRSLVADSSISFQVNDFFKLDGFTVVGFVVLALLSLGYYYFSRLLFRFVFLAFGNRYYVICFAIGLLGLLYLSLRGNTDVVLFHLPVLLWLIVYTFLFSQQYAIINRFKITLAGVLFWIFIFSASLSGIILVENQKKELATKVKMAQQQDRKTDFSQEKTMSIALAYLDNDFFNANFKRFTRPATNRFLRDSIISGNFFTSYQSAYTTQLYAFDSAQRGLYNEDEKTYAELNNTYTLRSKPTAIPNLYYHEPSYDKVIYLSKREVRDSGRLVGTFFIVCTPSRYNSETFLPELFRNVDRNDIENSPLYSYAMYMKGVLNMASSQYSFKTTLSAAEEPRLEWQLRNNGDYDELWYRVNKEKVVVIAKKRDTFLESITLFSYLFSAFLVMVALLQIVALLLRAAYGWKLVQLFSELSIRSQVHVTIIFVTVLSFVIIGITTISFFVQRYNRNNIDKIGRTSGIMIREMQKRIQDLGTLSTMKRSTDSAGTANLQRLVDDVAEIHYLDVNVYDLQGDLSFTSIDEVYRRGVLSTKMQPEAYYHLSRLREVQYVQEEKLGDLEYLSLYTTVRNATTGDVQAYLNIPYFTSQIDLQQEISNFLVTVINLNAFIFLIAGVIALFITNKITRSFSVIGEKMRAITLGKTNEEIVWNRKDEIGALVVQYNKMVEQLGDSAEALAKSEREGAWREMAKQVAHEIKNPLTPMKLSIQYLQKAISSGQPNVQDLTTRVANTLVEQIDHLSKIAADFSRFANIGNQQSEQFDVHEVLESLVDLYKANPKVNLHWNALPEPVLIYADRTHINRLFTNLLTNAVESCANKEECKIVLAEMRTETDVVILVQDNGEGIAADMQQKIFMPNFTTKTSGTGLGLAMCKGIAEQAGGSIWFETEQGKGTTFFVRLPLAAE